MLDHEGKIKGVTTTAILTERLVKSKVTLKDPVTLALSMDYRNVSSDVPLSELGRLFGRHTYVLVDGDHIASCYDFLEFYKNKN